MPSTWRIEYEPHAQKQLRKLDRSAAERIVRTLQQDLDRVEDPRAFGDYRAIARIEDGHVTIFIIEVAHRREVYR